tara:strand:+ start:181 stop:534 length:354 start_codon:yes stop_codon:yes gene_type:complete
MITEKGKALTQEEISTFRTKASLYPSHPISNQLDIKYQVKCEECNGTGKVVKELSIHVLLALLESSQGVTNKINFIKAIRAEWVLGLREAKELAEATLRFREEAIKVLGVSINGSTE